MGDRSCEIPHRATVCLPCCWALFNLQGTYIVFLGLYRTGARPPRLPCTGVQSTSAPRRGSCRAKRAHLEEAAACFSDARCASSHTASHDQGRRAARHLPSGAELTGGLSPVNLAGGGVGGSSLRSAMRRASARHGAESLPLGGVEAGLRAAVLPNASGARSRPGRRSPASTPPGARGARR